MSSTCRVTNAARRNARQHKHKIDYRQETDPTEQHRNRRATTTKTTAIKAYDDDDAGDARCELERIERRRTVLEGRTRTYHMIDPTDDRSIDRFRSMIDDFV
jgi:hypothetical protein